MKKNECKPFFSSVLLGSLMFITALSYAVPAYIPQALRDCVIHATQNGTSNEWQELCSMVAENRMLASDQLVRKALQDQLCCGEEDSNVNAYLRNYLMSMDQRSLLLALEGSEANMILLPTDLVARSFESNADMDMVYLSSQLATKQNVELCGCAEIDATRVPTLNQPSVIFNANAIMSPLAATPNIIIGTGITSPLMPAWIMSPSAQVQYPVSIQFPVPENLRADRDMELIFHFLATQQNAPSGAIKLRVEGSWVNIGEEFTSDDMVFVANSTDIAVVEPTSANLIRHVYASVPLNLTELLRIDFLRLAFTRITPDNPEYAADIYLAAIEFRYTAR